MILENNKAVLKKYIIKHKLSGYVNQSQKTLVPCGDGSETTSCKPLILLGFKLFCDYYSYDKNDDNYVEKSLKKFINVRFAI